MIVAKHVLGKIFEHAVREMKRPLGEHAEVGLIAVADYIAVRGRMLGVVGLNDDCLRQSILDWIKIAVGLHCSSFSKDTGYDLNLINNVNARLLESSYIASCHQPSAADVYLLLGIHSFVSSHVARAPEYAGIYRWYHQMQHMTPGAFDAFGQIEFDLSVPCINPDSSADTQDLKKEKPKSIQEEAPAVPPSRLDIRVGRIIHIEPHPDAESLYVEKIDLAETQGPRTVISGLVKHIPMDQLKDRLVLVLCNLKPAKMRGIVSQGMLLCSTQDGKVETLRVDDNSVIGESVVFEGFQDGVPDELLNPKKKIWESIQPCLRTNENGIAGYLDENNNHFAMKTKNTTNYVSAPNHTQSSIS